MYARNIELGDGTSYFLFGPRGTGKTYWLQHRFPGAVYIDLLAARTFNLLAADPQRLSDMIPRDHSGWVIVDEVQKLPPLLDEAHRLIEERGTRLILTGSSARKLKRSHANMLGGRAVRRSLHPLSANELGSDFDLGKALQYGTLPTLYDPDKNVVPEDYLAGYVQVYLKEEILQEGLTRDLGAFARFLEAASFSQAQVLNISETARECGVKRKLCEGYFGILEDLLIAQRLPAFQRRAKRRLVHHPKFFLFDTGVFRAVRPRGPLDSPEEIDGAALETLVYQNIRALVDWKFSDASLYYWRTSNGTEVDFVVYGPEIFAAIEVKRKRSLARRDLSGLKAFGRDYPEAQRFVFYGGEHRLDFDGVRAVPVDQALRSLDALL